MSEIKNLNEIKKQDSIKIDAGYASDNDHALKGMPLKFAEFYNDIVNSTVNFASNFVKITVAASTRLVALYALQIIIGYYNQHEAGAMINHNPLDHGINLFHLIDLFQVIDGVDVP